jgi:hypothetical protein
MTALPAAPNVLRTDMHWQDAFDNKALTRLHWLYSGTPPAAATINSLCQDLGAAWVTHCASLYAATGGLLAVDGQDLNTSSGANGSYPTNTSGTRSGAENPPNIAALINYSISRRYRGGKPRSYVPFGTQSDISSGTWSGSFVSAVTSGWSAMVAEFVGTAVSGCTISSLVNVGYFAGYTLGPEMPGGFRKKIPTPLSSPHIDVVNAITCNNSIGTQRKRRGKV